MKKVLSVFSAVICAFVIYIMTFMFVSVFVLSARSLNDWKRSETVTVTPDKIDISGNRLVSRKEVLLVSGMDVERSWFDIDENKIEQLLLSSGWVKKAFVKKIFPDSVDIMLEEFSPAIVVNSKTSGRDDNEKNFYTLWFADENGHVFKRAFPGEATAKLPFFHISYDSLSEKMRGKRIKTAVKIAAEWAKEPSRCKIRSIKYDFASGFSADCEADDSMTAFISFGRKLDDEQIVEMKEKFSKISSGLELENKWAGEYIFEKSESDGRIRVVVGKVFKNVTRGSDA